MPRGDKPTTKALALKDGWIYEDALPAAVSKEQYDWWFKESLVLDGVRMGPPLPDHTDNPALKGCPFCPAMLSPFPKDHLPEHLHGDAEQWFQITHNARCYFVLLGFGDYPIHKDRLPAWNTRAPVAAASPPCANCGHANPHDGPAGTVDDHCTEPGCNCGYYQPVAATVNDEGEQRREAVRLAEAVMLVLGNPGISAQTWDKLVEVCAPAPPAQPARDAAEAVPVEGVLEGRARAYSEAEAERLDRWKRRDVE